MTASEIRGRARPRPPTFGMKPTIIRNRYLLHEVIGAGGMGVVYRATDRMTQDEIALKRVAQRMVDFGFHSTSDFERELATEFRLLATLTHPNIIPVMDFGLDADGQPFYTMRLLRHAQTILDAGLSVRLEDRLRLLSQALRALAYLHRRGVMHRDLKPSNLLVEDRTVFLLDFGLALQQLSADGEVGTLLYAAPESLNAQKTTVASDIYALGVLAFQLFEGGHPYDLPSDASYNDILHAIKHQPIACQRLFANTDDDTVSTATADAIRALVSSMVQKNPAHRANDARALLHRFVDLIDETVSQETKFLLEMPQLVGRQQELGRLQVALDTVQAATRDVWAFVKAQPAGSVGSAWLIGGEGGVGKTRLLQEIALEALTKGFLVLRGQHQDTVGSPYNAWHNPVRHLALHSPPDAPQLSVLQRVVPSLGELLNQDVIPLAPEENAPQRLMSAVVSLFKNLNQPTLLLLEDLHHAEDSLLLLGELAAHVEQLPLVVIATYRDREHPNLHHKLPQLQHIALKRLTDSEIAQLSRNIIGQPTLDPSWTAWLAQQTEGNPFFLVETLRTLADQAGTLDAIPNTQQPQYLLPRGLEPIIQQRLQKISDIDRDLLYIAAVIGRELDLQILSLFNDDLDYWLVRCANAHVIAYEEGAWRFSHEKVREGVLAKLDTHYLKIAQWCAIVGFETIYPNDPLVATRLYALYEGIGQPDNAYQCALRAAEYAHATNDIDTALLWYETAFSFEAANPGVDVLLHYASALIQRDRIEMSLSVIAIAQEHPDPTPQQSAAICAMLAVGLYRRQDFLNALHYARRAVDAYRTLGDNLAMARAMISAGNVYRAIGNLDDARHFHRDALAVYEAAAQPTGQGRALLQLAIDAHLHDDLDVAEDLAARATTLAQDTTDVSLQAHAASVAGRVYLAGGRHFVAISRLQHSQHLATSIHDTGLIAHNHVQIGAAHAALRDYATAREHFLQGLRLAHALSPTHPTALDALVGMAALDVQTKTQPDRAVAWLKVIDDHPLTTAETRHAINQVRRHFATMLPTPADILPTLEDVMRGLLGQ